MAAAARSIGEGDRLAVNALSTAVFLEEERIEFERRYADKTQRETLTARDLLRGMATYKFDRPEQDLAFVMRAVTAGVSRGWLCDSPADVQYQKLWAVADLAINRALLGDDVDVAVSAFYLLFDEAVQRLHRQTEDKSVLTFNRLGFFAIEPDILFNTPMKGLLARFYQRAGFLGSVHQGVLESKITPYFGGGDHFAALIAEITGGVAPDMPA